MVACRPNTYFHLVQRDYTGNIRLSKIDSEGIDEIVRTSEDDPNSCLRTLLELVLEACGLSSNSIQDTQFFELGDVDEVVNEQVASFESSYNEGLTIFPLKRNMFKKYDKARDCYLEFWSTLVVQGRERLMFSDEPGSVGSQLSLRISDVFEVGLPLTLFHVPLSPRIHILKFDHVLPTCARRWATI